MRATTPQLEIRENYTHTHTVKSGESKGSRRDSPIQQNPIRSELIDESVPKTNERQARREKNLEQRKNVYESIES